MSSEATVGLVITIVGLLPILVGGTLDPLRTPVVIKIEASVSDLPPDQDARESFINGCLKFYTFYRKHKREMRFYGKSKRLLPTLMCLERFAIECHPVTAFRAPGRVFGFHRAGNAVTG